MRLRVMNSEDIPAAVRLKDAAGWNQTAVDWKRFLAASPEGCSVAECDGRVVGTSATIVYEDRFAWIGMIVVDQQHRGQGIGTALLVQAIQYLDSRSVPCMKLDATPEGKPLYKKFGFVSEYDIERWMLNRQSDENVAGKALEEIDDVLQLDREVFGADRGGLLHSLNATTPEFTQVIRQETKINGYALGRHGSRADQLGPWIACNEHVAAKLLDEFLRRSGRELVFVDCVQSNPWVLPLIKARGFEFLRPLTRMFRGINRHAGRPDLLCAILGPEFG